MNNFQKNRLNEYKKEWAIAKIESKYNKLLIDTLVKVFKLRKGKVSDG